jgi:SAM-dependent methyltransferase
VPPNDSATPFASAEAYYADHRPGYGEPAIEYLRGRFDLDDGSRVLDLGCGAGQVAVPVAAHAGSVLGMDPNPAMLREAEARAERAGRENLDWVVGSDAELAGIEGPFDLVTMGRSFHWMDQARTLERVHELTSPGGGVALLTNREWITRGTKEWQDAVYVLVGEYLADLPERTGPIEYDDPWDELVTAFGFTAVETATFEFERAWDVDSVVGYVFSLSFCSPATVGNEKEAFEADLRARLDRFDEPFVQDAVVTVIAGEK